MGGGDEVESWGGKKTEREQSEKRHSETVWNRVNIDD